MGQQQAAPLHPVVVDRSEIKPGVTNGREEGKLSVFVTKVTHTCNCFNLEPSAHCEAVGGQADLL